MSHTVLRPERSPNGRSMVAHAFDDDTAWFPWREALCGRELEGERLIASGVDKVRLCHQCAKHLAREEVSA